MLLACARVDPSMTHAGSESGGSDEGGVIDAPDVKCRTCPRLIPGWAPPICDHCLFGGSDDGWECIESEPCALCKSKCVADGELLCKRCLERARESDRQWGMADWASISSEPSQPADLVDLVALATPCVVASSLPPACVLATVPLPCLPAPAGSVAASSVPYFSATGPTPSHTSLHGSLAAYRSRYGFQEQSDTNGHEWAKPAWLEPATCEQRGDSCSGHDRCDPDHVASAFCLDHGGP